MSNLGYVNQQRYLHPIVGLFKKLPYIYIILQNLSPFRGIFKAVENCRIPFDRNPRTQSRGKWHRLIWPAARYCSLLRSSTKCPFAQLVNKSRMWIPISLVQLMGNWPIHINFSGQIRTSLITIKDPLQTNPPLTFSRTTQLRDKILDTYILPHTISKLTSRSTLEKI